MTPIALILETVDNLKDAIVGGPMALFNALRPLLLEFGTSSAIIDEDMQRLIMRRVHRALREARVIGGVDLP